MKLTADERGRLASAELFRPKATFDATVQPDGSIRLVELAEKQVPIVKPRRINGRLRGAEVAAHAVKGNGHLADFIPAGGRQWKIEVAFGQRANACDQTGQRLGESM